MALPPADDGEQELTTEDQREPLAADPEADASQGPSRRTLVVASAALALVIVACAVFLGIRFTRDTDPDASVLQRAETVLSAGDAADEQATRETVMRQGRQFVLRLFNYGPDDLSEDGKLTDYAAGVTELMTPKFTVSFEQGVTFAEQAVAAGNGRTGEVSLIGVRDLSADSATVMVAGRFVGTLAVDGEAGEATAEPTPFRLDLSMVRSDGKWLVDNYVPVTGEEETAAPGTEAPGSAPSASPSQGQGQNQNQGRNQGQNQGQNQGRNQGGGAG